MTDTHHPAPRYLRPLILPALMALAVLLASCGKTSTGPESTDRTPTIDLWPTEGPTDLDSRRTGCDVLAGEARGGGSFLIALTDSIRVDRAPIPHNPSERLLFAQLYETLVQVDCSGEIQPGLAESWTCTEDSTVWVFFLREDARFWDGSRVTTDEVRKAWARNQNCPRTSERSSPWTWFDSRARSITILDARRLAIQLPEPQARFPMLLAHPATAVAARREGWTWPVGSGPCRLRASDPAPRPDLACRPNTHHPRAPRWKQLTFRVQPGADPRDLVTLEPDLTVVRELEDVRFFDAAPGTATWPLPWDRLYLLVMPPVTNPDGPGRWLAAAGRVDPGRDVTRVSARSWPEIVLPGGGSGSCPQVSGPVATGSSARLEWGLDDLDLDGDAMAYPAGDAGAEEFAHRLTALTGGPARSVALPAAGLAFALQWQMAGACVVPLDLDFPTGCLQLATLLGKAAWLQEAALGTGPDGAPNSLGDAERLVPSSTPAPTDILIDRGLVRPLGLSRPWLVARGELAGIVLDFDGTPRLAGLGTAGVDTP